MLKNVMLKTTSSMETWPIQSLELMMVDMEYYTLQTNLHRKENATVVLISLLTNVQSLEHRVMMVILNELTIII